MDKFFSNLTGGGDKNKSSNDNNQRKKDDGTSWQGGRSGDMESIRNSRNVASRVGSGRVGGGSSGSSGGNANGNRPSNIFANAGAGINEALGKIDLFNQNKKNEAKARGGGQSLGGSLPGRVFSVCLDQPGHLGMEVERRKNSQGTTIISRVVPGSQAATAGLQRGDIVCHAGTNGSKEIPYDEILAMARSGRRPLKFDVRRIESNLGVGSNSTISGGVRVSADAEARKQAMIAAAEAREAKHKAKTKPVPRTASTEKIYLKGKQNDATRQQPQYEVNESEETKRAIAAVKKAEQDDAKNLGYNPYEAKAMTGGQARTATVAMTRGEINVGNAPQKLVGGDVSAPGRVSAPKDPTEEVSDAHDVPIEFEHAFTTLVTSNDNNNAVVKSMGIMRKLIINATTKGQEGNLDDENSFKFRRVRLSNPKIKEAVADLLGGLELMMIVGFQLIDNEDDGETYLVFPPGEKGPKWLGDALARMESYENGGF